MANKRMFSVEVTETDAFLEMPLTAQALYFHLGMHGDDDGFVSNPRSIMRSVGCTDSDLQALIDAGYVMVFDSGVLVITDWKLNNSLRNDRYKPTMFQAELAELSETANKRYISRRKPSGNQLDTNGIPTDNHWYPQHNITEHSSSKGGPAAPTAADFRTDSDLAELVQHFQQVVGEFPRCALDRLQRWREVFPAEVLCRSFDEAAESGHRSWRYIDGILGSWQADGVRTLGDVEARRDARKKSEPPPEKKWEMLT